MLVVPKILSSYDIITQSKQQKQLLFQQFFTKSMSVRERIRGINFDGTAEIKQDTISAQLVDFKFGCVYKFTVSTENLQRESKRYLVFRRINELFQQLTLNNQMEITEEGQLILSIQVAYQGRLQSLTIQLTLQKQKIESEKELNRIIFREMQRLSRETACLEKYKQKIILFRGDEENLNYRHFQESNGGKVVKYTGNSTHSIYNHCQALPKSGIFYFRTKIIKTYGKNLIFGICTADIKSLNNTYHSPNFIGLLLSERTLLGNNKSDIAISPVQIIEGRTVIKVEIDFKKGIISWYLDDGFLCARKLPHEILAKYVHPLISFYNSGDTVQFLTEQ